jgi:hypothetical protein
LKRPEADVSAKLRFPQRLDAARQQQRRGQSERTQDAGDDEHGRVSSSAVYGFSARTARMPAGVSRASRDHDGLARAIDRPAAANEKAGRLRWDVQTPGTDPQNRAPVSSGIRSVSPSMRVRWDGSTPIRTAR